MDLSAVDVPDLVEKLGLANARLTSSGREVNFSCFGAEHSHGDESPSAYINVETTAWFCHGCKRRGNALSLIVEVQQISQPEAERFLRENYGIDFLEPQGGSMVAETDARFRPPAEEPPFVPPPRSWLISARFDWMTASRDDPWVDYMFGRGFAPEVLADWDIGYDYLSDRVTIPVFDVDENLVGIKGRAYRDDVQPKYRVLGDTAGMVSFGFQPYDPKDVVFGLHRARGHRTAVVFEGELNAVAASQVGVPRPVAAGMSYFSLRHAQLLAREVDEVVLFFDYGTAGHAGLWGIHQAADGKSYPGAVQLLEPYVRVRVADPLPEDPSKLVELGRGDEVLDIIDRAQSSVAAQTILR
jgi:DNA primase